jgi:hypothetical protein
VPASGEINEKAPDTSWLSTMEKPALPLDSTSETATALIAESCGGLVCSVSMNRSTSSCAPSISIVTPDDELKTYPVSPSECASLYTNGRNPTPCTIPRTSMRLRLADVLGGVAIVGLGYLNRRG